MQDLDLVYMAAILRNLGVLAIRQFMPGEFDKILELIEQEKRLLKMHARPVKRHAPGNNVLDRPKMEPSAGNNRCDNDRINHFEIGKKRYA